MMVSLLFKGTSSIYYYRTPAEMFEGGELETDSADTTRDVAYILDQQGEVRRTVATGTRVFFPNIPGIGAIRQRLVRDTMSADVCYTLCIRVPRGIASLERLCQKI